jgi:hypothetical protein
MMVWNRVLSKEEAFDAMADAGGRNLEIGVVNSSAGEFARSASDAAGVFDAESMPWSRMRGNLDSANPVLSFKTALPEREERISRVLSVVSVDRGLQRKVPVDVFVNGQKAGSMEWEGGRRSDFFVPDRLMARDGDGMVTFRLECTGELNDEFSIDHISLGGSWIVGSRDGSLSLREALFRPGNTAYVDSFVVDGKYASQYPDQLNGTNSSGVCYTRRPYSLRFELPGKIAQNHRARFSFSTTAAAGTSYAYHRQSIAVDINGKFFTVMDNLGEGTALNRIDIPAGTFKDGMNVISLVNVTDVSKDSYWGIYSPVVKFASHSLEFRNNAGAMIFVR